MRWRRQLLWLAALGAVAASIFTSSASATTMGRYAVAARWINTPYGATLSVTPSGLAQAMGTPAATGMWNDAFAMAGWRPYSSQVYASMYEQLQCHLWYVFKTPYNLDTWRAQVPWWYELYRRCNP
ncbi:MAG: hypothetical protein QOE69_467 [Thermoleophilaceae bacterium]|nr:hypothetical protein [Thermoleophilaceae bacterium]